MTAGIPPRERFITLLFVVSFLVCTLFLFGPLHIFFTNRVEFYIDALDIIPLLAAVCLAAAGAAILPLLFLPPRLFTRTVAVLFACAVLFWLQGNVLVWRIGVLDGREIPWASLRAYGYVDSAVWAALLAVALVKPAHVYAIARRTSAAFLLIQLAAVVVTAARTPGRMSCYAYVTDETQKFAFSNRQNVIILVIDSLQSDVFQEIVDENDRYRDVFSGFTYFRNALGGYPSTYPCVSFILTGRYYDNSIPIQEFIKTTFSTASIPQALRAHGWRVTLPLSYTLFNDEGIATNLKKKTLSPFRMENLGPAADLYDTALLRYLPLFAKKYVYVHERGLLKRAYLSRIKARMTWSVLSGRMDSSMNADLEFVDRMTREARAGDIPSTFAYFHLNGPHLPFSLNEDLEYKEMPFSRESYTHHSHGMVRIAEKFIATLRALGVYDSSMIFIVADHGLVFPVSDSFCASRDRDARREGGPPPPTDDDIFSRGIPLFMVKPFHAEGRLRVSDAPVTNGDIPATVASALGIAESFPGTPVFQVNAEEPRARRFLYFKWDDRWNAEYLPRMTEYVVRGFSGCRSSWAPTGRQFYPPSHKAYAPGAEITFGENGNSIPYEESGWSFPEAGFTWTSGNRASLRIPLAPPASDLVLRAVVKPLRMAGRVDAQRAYVGVNGKRVGEWRVDAKGEYRVTIPTHAIEGPTSLISFDLPDARVPPKEHGGANPPRQLGLRFYSIRLEPQKPPRSPD